MSPMPKMFHECLESILSPSIGGTRLLHQMSGGQAGWRPRIHVLSMSTMHLAAESALTAAGAVGDHAAIQLSHVRTASSAQDTRPVG